MCRKSSYNCNNVKIVEKLYLAVIYASCEEAVNLLWLKSVREKKASVQIRYEYRVENRRLNNKREVKRSII